MKIWIVHQADYCNWTAEVTEIHTSGTDAMRSCAAKTTDFDFDGPFNEGSFQIGDIITEDHLDEAYLKG